MPNVYGPTKYDDDLEILGVWSDIHTADWWRRTEREIHEEHGKDVNLLGYHWIC
jgi:hypothetical protein